MPEHQLPEGLVPRFDGPGVLAIALFGSHASGEAGPFSDVDLLRLLADDAENLPGDGTHLIDGRLVNLSSARLADTEAWFERPEQAVGHVLGLRQARALLDRDESFLKLQARAQGFAWDAAMQDRADRWASRQLVGWAEEAHKSLEGLRRGDVGRLLNGRHGGSWGLNGVMQVQRGVLTASDNAFFAAVGAALVDQPEWLRLRRVAFGIDEAGGAPTLAEQVQAGLRLYVLTTELLEPVLHPDDQPIIAHTVAQIRRSLGDKA